MGLGILWCEAASDENGLNVLCMVEALDGDNELIFVSEKPCGCENGKTVCSVIGED